MSQMTNFIQFPGQKCKHSTMYTHTWYVQTPELLKEFICRITGPGFAYLSRNLRRDLDRSFGKGKIKAALFFSSFVSLKEFEIFSLRR